MRLSEQAAGFSNPDQSGLNRELLQERTSLSEELHIRSYDHERAYDLDVEVTAKNGQDTFQDRYYILPGHSESESNVLPHGHVQVDVTLDNAEEASLECRVDETPEHTVMIEVGNGALSLTEGINLGRGMPSKPK